MFKRAIEDQIKKDFFKAKVIIIVGPRQVGKTTLSLKVTENREARLFNCDNPTERELLDNKDIDFLKRLVGKEKVIVIDEAQKVPSIGQTLKLLVDYYKKEKQIIATGSSSINLIDNTHEPLTGRKIVYNLYPLSIQEIYSEKKPEFIKSRDQDLIYGTYPEIVNKRSFEEKIDALKEISSSYLYKDIFEFQQIRNSTVIFNLLRALALQIGSEVSYNELGNLLGIDKKTVERYIDLLEKSFIIFRLSPYTKNKRKEISRMRKIFFYDIGIRNAIINNFNPLDSRNDHGQIFENFCILERIKYRHYNKVHANQYFWRTYEGNEVDLIEEKNGRLYAYEFKLNKAKKKKIRGWKDYKIITKQTIFEFIT